MLIKCPECELQVSDKAPNCPHCGYPLQSDIKQRKTRSKNNKRRRLPNGFGQISEIKNRNLRKPFRAMVSVGKAINGRPICKPLKPESYFSTYNEAYEALVEYNKNPYDLEPSMTILQLYDKWTDTYFKNLKNPNSITSTKSAWSYCHQLYDMRVIDVRARHIKGCLDEGTANVRGKIKKPSSVMKNKIKIIFNLMLDYAVEYELVDRNYSRAFKLPDEVIKEITTSKNGHITFANDEITTLWNNVDNKKYVDILLIQCYSGWRPQELGLIELKNVDIENWYFTGGMKTEAGTERIVPIHSKIQPLVLKRYNEAISLGSDYLLNCPEIRTYRKSIFLTYERYQRIFNAMVKELNLNPEHKPHDGRTYFITTAKKCKVDEYAIKYMVGHRIQDITEKVYTKREIDWLKAEMEKIK